MLRPESVARALGVLLTVGVLAACGDDDNGPTGLDPNLYELGVVAGGGQTGIAGTVLDQPLRVDVRRKDTGAPEEGVAVRWSVVSGSGEPTRSTSATDADGLATTRIALGPSAGEVIVEAEVAGLEAVSFNPMTVLPVPTIGSLSPSSADPGDTIEVRVNNLPVGMQVQVLFDGVAGHLVDRADGSPAVLSAVVPAPAGACAATSQTVDVRARVDGVTTGSSQLTVTVPQDPFQIGQVLVMENASEVNCALLPADGGTAKYLLVALSGAFEQDGEFRVTLGGNNVSFATVDAGPRPLRASFDSRLRAFEQYLAAQGVAPARPPQGDAQLFAEPQVGDIRQFWVLNDVDATDDNQLTRDEFDRVTATLRFVGANTLVYVDNASPEPGLTESDLEFIGATYDRRLFNVASDFFGEPSDVDNDGRVILLLSPTVNSLTPRSAEGVIVGFFFGLDLLSSEFSNRAELFYGLVPDPDGTFSDARSKNRVLELLPGVMVHETQHMIDFRYKVFENNKNALETLWLSEGLAHAAEELGGDAVEADGDLDLADDLYASNFGRAARYLMAPDSFSLTSSTSGQGSLGERGAWWIFLRWLADQYGDFIFRDLTQAAPDGVANVEAQTGEDFFRLFADFAIAMWADDQNIPGLAERFQVPKWLLRSILQVEPPGGGSRVYALQPERETFTTFRSSSMTEFLVGSSAFYIELEADGDTQDLQLSLTSATDAGLAILRYE